MIDKNIIDKFEKYLQEKHRSRYTIIAYKKDLLQFFEFLDKEKFNKLDQVTAETIQAFLKTLFKKNFMAKTVSRKINTIKTFFKFANQELKIIDQNPALSISHPRVPTKGPHFLSKLEYRALRDVVRDNPRMYAVVELMLQTGLRIGEVARLRKSDFKGNKLYIQAFESHGDREVPLNRNAQKAIEKYLKIRPESENNHLFLTRTGTSLSIRNIRSGISRAFKKAGVENARVSDIRHTFIAQQLLQGTPVVVVSKIVGHKRTETTSRYLDYLKDYKFQSYSLHEL